MKIGFSFSPGGLLLPYHLGVLTSLARRGFITTNTPLAGSSAGAIAVAAHGTGLSAKEVMEATMRINQRCFDMDGASGNLLPLLEEELENVLPPDAHEILNEREEIVGIAFKQLFPSIENVLQTSFQSREDLIEAVCNSSMFPFFSTRWPVRFVSSQRKPIADGDGSRGSGQLKIPRVVVDGFFTVPRERFGCPVFPNDSKVDRTVFVSVFPRQSIGLTATNPIDCICPQLSQVDASSQIEKLIRRATSPSVDDVCWEMFSEGEENAISWMNLQ